jgi:hypothetical protein
MDGWTMNDMVCPCGESKEHVVARRLTADRIGVILWDNGAITNRFNTGFPGIPVSRPRTQAALVATRDAGWLFISEVELFDRRDLPLLYEASRKATDRASLYAHIERAKRPKFVLNWRTYQTDRDGRPTVRVARLGMQWPGLVVWHEGGAYEILERGAGRGEDTLWNTGFKFKTQRDLATHLMQVKK